MPVSGNALRKGLPAATGSSQRPSPAGNGALDHPRQQRPLEGLLCPRRGCGDRGCAHRHGKGSNSDRSPGAHGPDDQGCWRDPAEEPEAVVFGGPCAAWGSPARPERVMGTARVPLVNEREISSTVHVFRTAHRTVNHTGNCTVSYGVSCALVGVSCVGPAAAGAGGKNRAGAGCPADGGSHRPSFPRTKTLAYAASFAGASPRPLGCLKLLRSRVLRTRKLLDHVPCSSRQPSGHPPFRGEPARRRIPSRPSFATWHETPAAGTMRKRNSLRLVLRDADAAEPGNWPLQSRTRCGHNHGVRFRCAALTAYAVPFELAHGIKELHALGDGELSLRTVGLSRPFIVSYRGVKAASPAGSPRCGG